MAAAGVAGGWGGVDAPRASTKAIAAPTPSRVSSAIGMAQLRRRGAVLDVDLVASSGAMRVAGAGGSAGTGTDPIINSVSRQ